MHLVFYGWPQLASPPPMRTVSSSSAGGTVPTFRGTCGQPSHAVGQIDVCGTSKRSNVRVKHVDRVAVALDRVPLGVEVARQHVEVYDDYCDPDFSAESYMPVCSA